MRALGCKKVRLWMQAPLDLDPSSSYMLRAHLEECSACRLAWRQVADVDHRVQKLALAASNLSSVRADVLARLGSPPGHPAARSNRRRTLFRRPTRHARRRHRKLVLPLAVAALMAALAVPQDVTVSGIHMQPVGAAWRITRAQIGFPLALDATRADHLLVGADGQVLESFDAGNTWHRLAPLPPHLVIRALAIDRTDAQRFLVATRRSIYVSEDAGRHWRETAASMLGAMNMFLVQDAQSPNTFYAGPSVLWISTDRGRSWRMPGRGTVFAPDGIQSLAARHDGTLITGIWHGGVAVSRDRGVTWHRRARGLAPNVMDVSLGAHDALWAATDRGLYRAPADAASWTRVGPGSHFFATTVTAAGHTLLAGGDGALYRSVTGGLNWALSMSGLPLAPYINDLVRDPFHPERVYASLNSDGIFRSDDGGLHWVRKNAGIPISTVVAVSDWVLFRRNGALWITDSSGSDPEALTIDKDVRTAALTPDGAGVAYAAGSGSSWRVRVLASGGSAAETVTRLTGVVPPRLVWSPESSLLAVIESGTVLVTDRSHRIVQWSVLPNLKALGWSADGTGLLFWDAASAKIEDRRWRDGHILPAGALPAIPGYPVQAPDRSAFALVSDWRLEVIAGTRSYSVGISPSCAVRAWTMDSRAIVLTCKSGVEVRDVHGRLLQHFRLPASSAIAPSSSASTETLVFTRGSLWSAGGRGGLRRIVPNAYPL